jgi:hypothetical protein
VDGTEASILRCLAQLAAATGSQDLLTQADGLLGQAACKKGAWIPGFEAYLALARASLERREPEHARAVLAPLLAVARSTPWKPVLAEVLVADGTALAVLGRQAEAKKALRLAEQLAAEHQMPHVRAAAGSALGTLR